MRKRKFEALKNTILFGFLTTAVYSVIFANTELVMRYFTKGGFYAALPVMTAFVVSFLHGAFTGNFWTAIGIEASKKTFVTTQPAKRVRPRSRPRLYLRAE